jgi:hypothetical protein
MGLFERLRSAVAGPRLADELAILAGQSEELVSRLRRHAERVAYPKIAQDIREIADREEAQQKTMRAALAERGMWPRPPMPTSHEGANAWERLSIDLEILLQLARNLHQHAMRWEGDGGDPALGDALMKVANEASVDEFELRLLVAKLDPQALD